LIDFSLVVRQGFTLDGFLTRREVLFDDASLENGAVFNRFLACWTRSLGRGVLITGTGSGEITSCSKLELS